jgi:hypothetical protein
MSNFKYTQPAINSHTSDAWSEVSRIPQPASPLPWRADDAWYVSPQHTVADLYSESFETRVAIVESRFGGWIFDQAHVLASRANPHHQQSGFAILTLTTAYFEAITEFRTGEDSSTGSKRCFRAGFREVFPGLVKNLAAQGAPDPDGLMDIIANTVYDEIRCGLFHNATARSRVRLAWGMKDRACAFQLDGSPLAVSWIMIQPQAFTKSIENHFSAYLDEVRNAGPGSEVRRLFDLTFDRRIKRR